MSAEWLCLTLSAPCAACQHVGPEEKLTNKLLHSKSKTSDRPRRENTVHSLILNYLVTRHSSQEVNVVIYDMSRLSCDTPSKQHRTSTLPYFCFLWRYLLYVCRGEPPEAKGPSGNWQGKLHGTCSEMVQLDTQIGMHSKMFAHFVKRLKPCTLTSFAKLSTT